MQEIFEVFERAGKEIFLVGGAVRDLARGIPLKELDDMDYCTNARPQETLRILKDAGFTTYDVGIEFGTVGAVLKGPADQGYPKDCQITTYRSAEYYRRGSRHPDVKFGDTIEQDLCRRDFSINSIAMNGHGDYVDPYDGLGDLSKGVLRVVSDPLETLAEDPLRILRVGRFMSKLGFEPSKDLRDAATERAGYILDISRERWLMEMNKLVRGPHAVSGLEFLKDVRILGIILPEVAGLYHDQDAYYWNRTMRMLPMLPARAVYRWAALLHAIGEPFKDTRQEAAQLACVMSEGIFKRYKSDKQLAHEVRHLLRHRLTPLSYRRDWHDAQTRRLIQQIDPMAMESLIMAEVEIKLDAKDDMQDRLDDMLHLERSMLRLESDGSLRPELPSGLGNALIETFNLKPSRLIGELKDHLEERILDGILRNGEDTMYYIEDLRQNPPPALEAQSAIF